MKRIKVLSVRYLMFLHCSYLLLYLAGSYVLSALLPCPRYPYTQVLSLVLGACFLDGFILTA
jgi:hypothetical protein